MTSLCILSNMQLQIIPQVNKHHPWRRWSTSQERFQAEACMSFYVFGSCAVTSAIVYWLMQSHNSDKAQEKWTEHTPLSGGISGPHGCMRTCDGIGIGAAVFGKCNLVHSYTIRSGACGQMPRASLTQAKRLVAGCKISKWQEAWKTRSSGSKV